MANKYPPVFSILEPMIPIVRRSLIHEMEMLREDVPARLIHNYWQSAFEEINELQAIDNFLKELDKQIRFDDDDEVPF